MKKILLASTALVGFAGAAAAAEVTLSGYAEMGIAGGDLIETQFHNDVVINFNFSGTMDNGVEFGGKVQLDDTNGGGAINGAPTFDDEAFWVSGTFGKITLGETDGAFDWALSEIYTGTSLTDDHSTHAGAYWFTGLDATYDNQIMRYEYSFGDFAAGLSAEMDDTGVGDTVFGLGGKWSGQMGGMDVGVGLGYQDNGVNSVWGLSASAAMSNGFSVAFGYADLDGTSDAVGNGVLSDSWMGVGVAYTTGALTVGVNYGVYEASVAGVSDPSGWGVVANYDLGGGAVAMAGYGASDNGLAGNGAGDNSFSLGLGLSF
ncbi:MAG: porin [Albidovulum sp.]|uniref:porin n=1 Tax=Albidovulum sp. TaxID=1872424 RepID=UPI001321C81E|nr:porin [Defluviimonas sp.]KAB2886104.1 MAG: porin [Defluviimonas sp.]